MISLLARNWRVLVATTRIELLKRYYGSFLGSFWLLLYPLLFLSVYLFLYLVVFRIRLPGLSQLDYVTFIFSGLVPYMTFMEALAVGAVALKQNMHLIRNVILPVELIPTRAVTISILAQLPGLGMVLLLSAFNGTVTPALALLPIAVALQLAFLLGLVWMIAPLGLMMPDVGYATNLIILFLLFISPIGFMPDAVPAGWQALIYANPIHYMLLPFRMSFLGAQPHEWSFLLVTVGMSIVTFSAGSFVFFRFKAHLADYE